MKSIKKSKYFIAIFAILTLLITSPSCSSTEGVSKEVLEAEKEQDRVEKEAMKEYESAVKKHRQQQSDYAKQLMKDMKKRQKKNNKIRKRSLWDQLFNKKCK